MRAVDFEIRIKIGELVDSLSENDKKTLARHLAMEKPLIDSVVGQLVNGFTEDGSCNSEHFIEKIRLQVLDLLPKIEIETTRKILNDRKCALANEKRIRDWAWTLYHAWPEHHLRERPNTLEHYPFITTTSEEAELEIERVKKSKEVDK